MPVNMYEFIVKHVSKHVMVLPTSTFMPYCTYVIICYRCQYVHILATLPRQVCLSECTLKYVEHLMTPASTNRVIYNILPTYYR